MRHALVSLFCFVFVVSSIVSVHANDEKFAYLFDRHNLEDIQSKSLKLYNIHTGEKVDATFWRDGQYNARGLKKLDHFLRDWRVDKTTEMDVSLLTLVFFIRRRLEQEYPHLKDEYIEVISGYRSPETNISLSKAGRNVATKSQHIHGKAIDIRFPGVPVKKARDVALEFGIGGVGYYPKSGFIHVDTGRVRQW